VPLASALAMTRALRWVPALVWMSIIAYWSSQSDLPIDRYSSSSLLHRLSHVGAYSVLALLLLLATGTAPAGLLLAFVLAALYGLGDEIHQSFTPNRSPSLRDWTVDVVSAGVTVAAARPVYARLPPTVRRRLSAR
jgi:VanZ family protein